MTNVKLDFTSISYTYSNHTQESHTHTHTYYLYLLSDGDDANSLSIILLDTVSSSCNHSNTNNGNMEEVWKDINISGSNHPAAAVKDYRGFILQDFLGKPFASNDKPTTVSSSGFGSPSPPPPTQPQMLLNLNSGPDQLNFLTQDPTQNVCPLDVPSSGLLGHSIGGLRMFPATDKTGGDRRHKRMIKNRESAARSRARKQAYTNELENEVERLKEENALLKRQQQKIQVTTASQTTKKGGLRRTSTAPF